MSVVFHEKNEKGRDFIVGDIHGCYAEFLGALKKVSFNATADRVFSVGDIIDRGPQSFKCLSLLTQPWFHAVVGNHEAMLLNWLNIRDSDYHAPHSFHLNGGAWVDELTPKQRQLLLDRYVPLIEALPYVRQVADDVLPFSVVHAQRFAPRGVILTDDVLEEPLSMTWQSALTWGRGLNNACLITIAEHESANRKPVKPTDLLISPQPLQPGLGLTYCGHNTLAAKVLHLSHLHLDTGLYLERRTKNVPLVSHAEFVIPKVAHLFSRAAALASPGS